MGAGLFGPWPAPAGTGESRMLAVRSPDGGTGLRWKAAAPADACETIKSEPVTSGDITRVRPALARRHRDSGSDAGRRPLAGR